ncbi:MAG TPA: efflux RND transporter periplasmic adaptor subunit [Stellaceae bacterium]|nr:efflux RND transporter periplasmic adaptor subunit [Stellaceae bacterium]
MTPKGGGETETERDDAGARRGRPVVSRVGMIVLALLVVTLAVGIYRGIRGREVAATALAHVTEEDAIPTVSIVHPEARPPDQEIVLPGNVQAFEETPIYARTNGYLRHWYFDIGAHVKKGDLLAEIETPEADEQLRQARADLATAQANLAVAESTWKRDKTLYKDSWVSGQVRDTSYGTYEADKTIVASKEADVKRLERLQSYEKVYAPFDGIITARNTDVGALIDAGANSSARELFHLSATAKVRIFTAVPEVYTRLVHAGEAADVTLDEYPGEMFHGTMVRSTDAIDPVSRTLTVEVDVDNPDGRLLPGAYAFVHLTLPERARTASVTVPAEALIFRKEGLRVAVLRKGLAQLVPIVIGRDYGTKVEVVSGLQPSDDVILDPSDSLTNDTAVRAQPSTFIGSAQ